jgi:hypothetical protein
MTRSSRFSIARPWWPALLVLASAGCEQVKKLDEDPQAGLPCEVQRVLTESCAIEGGACHTASAQVPDLSAASAADTVFSPSAQGIPYVEIGNLAGSYMAVKIMEPPPEGAPTRIGALMPTPPGMISEADRALLVGWMAGAEIEACVGGSAGDDGAMTTTGSVDPTAADSTTGPAEPVACGVMDLDNGGTIRPIDAGDAAGQIPTEIGGILEGNCGCHFTDMVVTGFAVYPASLPLDMTTLEGFMADVNGTPAPERVAMRLQGMGGAIMPNPPCLHESGETMDPELRDILLAWLEAGVPDGATWTGM